LRIYTGSDLCMIHTCRRMETGLQYLDRSPITYVQNINTPLLIIQAREDHRCPLEQAEQLYTAMKVLGKECELAIFPDESHVFSRSGQPRHREERLEMIVEWFDRYLARDDGPDQPSASK